MKAFCRGVAVVALLSAGAGVAQAAAINFQLGAGQNSNTARTYTGTGANSGGTPGVTDSGTTWNNFQSPTGGTATLDSQGNTLTFPVALSVTATGAVGRYNGGTGSATTSSLSNLLDYYDFVTGSATTPNTGTFTLTNVPVGTYDLYVYSVNGTFGKRGTTFTVAGTSASTVNASNGPDSSFQNGVNYVVFPSLVVSPSGAGSLTGTLSGTFVANSGAGVGTNPNYEGDLNGFQLVSTPEPASLSLLAAASFGLLLRRRRSK